MGLLEALLTPRGSRRALDAPRLPLEKLEANNVQHRPGTHRLSSMFKQMLTPRSKQQQPQQEQDESCISPPGSGLIQAYRPTLTGLMERAVSTTTPRAAAVPPIEVPSSCTSETASDAGSNDSDLSSLDGFGAYARGLSSVAEAAECGGSSASSTDELPSPRQLLAPVQLCTPRASARDAERAAEDLAQLLRSGELPGSRQRVARMLAHADSLGPEAFSGLGLQGLGFERCVVLLHQLLLPLPLASRSAALAALQSKLAQQLLGFLGTSLERVLESERACQRWCRLPFDVAAWLLEHGPCDRGETLFDLANLWLEQQQRPAAPEQQAALAALVWRRPLAADFLRCMSANLPWAADYVAQCPLRPAHLPPSLDGRFSFTAEFELDDLLTLQQSAISTGRPSQSQSLAVYCGGLCWWAVLVANPRLNRFELYASCAAFSLFQEPYRAALQPAADVRFSFQGATSLLDWRQSNSERLAAMHTHWGGPAFWAPPSCPSLRIGGGTPDGARRGMQLAAAARPDTARGQRPARQMSRLALSSSGSGELSGQLQPLPSARSLGSGGSLSSGGPVLSARGSRGSCSAPGQAAYSEAGSGALTARGPAEPEGGWVPLNMEQLIAEVRRSCPVSWSASLRVRVNLKLAGGSGRGEQQQ